MRRISILRSEPKHRAFLVRPSLTMAGAACAVALLSACAPSAPVARADGTSVPSGEAQGESRTTRVPAANGVAPDPFFLFSEAASEAAEFMRLGRESMRDAAWPEAVDQLDSAGAHLALLEVDGNLDPSELAAVYVARDSVNSWLLEATAQAGQLGAEGVADYIDHEIEEVSLASLEDLEALLARLPDRNFDLPIPDPVPHSVLQAMRVFTGSGRGYFERWLQRRSRYEDMILAKLEERGMPRDLLYLSMIESGFNPRAWSHASASGLWQFISGTGRRYGLHDNWWEDPRRDPVRATDAALDYLEDLYAEFGDWHQAMAAYNCGEGRIRRQLRLNPGQTYWDMSLPKETRYYVPKILAAMIIGRNPQVFGFNPDLMAHEPLTFDTVTVTRTLPLRGVAQAVGVSEDSVKNLNPALRRWSTPPGNARYTLYLPVGSRDRFLSNLDGIDTVPVLSLQRHRVTRGQTLSGLAARYGVTVTDIRAANGLRGSLLRVGQVLTIPVPGSGDGASASVASSGSHRVRSGETLSGIASRYRVSLSALRQANGMRPGDVLRAGVTLDIPGRGGSAGSVARSGSAGGAIHVVRSGETLSGIAARTGTSVSQLRRLNGIQGSTIRVGQRLRLGGDVLVASSGEYHLVRSGDNLWDISNRYGHTVDELKRLNDGLSESIRPGQRIRVR